MQHGPPTFSSGGPYLALRTPSKTIGLLYGTHISAVGKDSSVRATTRRTRMTNNPVIVLSTTVAKRNMLP